MGAITTDSRAQAYTQLVATNALPALMGVVRMAKLVNRSFDNAVGQQGQTVNIEIEPTMTANNIAEGGSVQLQSPAPSWAQVNLHTHAEATFAIPDMAKVLNSGDPDGLIRKYMNPALIALAEKVETDLHKLYPRIDLTAGATNAAISEDALDKADKVLFTNKVPALLPRYISMHADCYSTLRQTSRLTETQTIGSGNAIVTGDVGTLKGFNIFRSQFAVKDGSSVYHNIAFTPDLIALVFARMPKIEAGTGAVSTFVDFEGFGMRVIQSFNPNTLVSQFTLDMLYGCQVIRPTFGVDIQSNA